MTERNDAALAQQQAGILPVIPWAAIPFGVAPGVAMAQADRDSRVKRRTPLQDALDGNPGGVYHPVGPKRAMSHDRPSG
jgi:hypothetical protein